jgi:ABC-2 type transport system ATP-binding protein
MSISVNQLTKNYGDQKAIDNISFEVKPGEILGFLGPNGAGKSTTMKILTCYIPPTSGAATVCGFDINKQSMDVRKNIGYLPEHNPLYLEMYVKEYLSFIADLHKVPNKKKRIDEMVELTGLSIEQHKKIGQLSKGYRQRTGLASALIHDPKVLILDEPTTGLDPNQIVEIRSLIKEIGKNKTVVLSTHIMQEVQAMCNRVVIINKGNIVADDKIEKLQQLNKNEKIFIVEFDKSIDKSLLLQIGSVVKCQDLQDNKWKINSNDDIRNKIFDFAVKNNISLLSLNEEKQSLEDIFRHLTQETTES